MAEKGRVVPEQARRADQDEPLDAGLGSPVRTVGGSASPEAAVEQLTARLERICELYRLQTLELKRLEGELERHRVAAASERASLAELAKAKRQLQKMEAEHGKALKRLRKDAGRKLAEAKRELGALRSKVKKQEQRAARLSGSRAYRLGSAILSLGRGVLLPVRPLRRLFRSGGR